MKSKKKLWITVIIFIFLLAGAVFLYQFLDDTKREGGLSSSVETEKETSSEHTSEEETSEKNTSEQGTTYPDAIDFTVQDADGNRTSLSDFFGKPIVLNFWNSNCPPCRQEMPDFQQIAKENPDIHFMMVDTVGLNGETIESVKAYIEESGFSFPVYYDINMEAVSAYGIRAFPTTFLINKDGKVQAYQEGMLDKESLQNALPSIR